VHYGLGSIGLEVARLVAERSELRSVGAVDVRPELIGKHLGELIAARGGRPNVVVSEARAALAAPGADVVAHCTGSSLERVVPQLVECVEAGLSVVSTCEELSYPRDRAPEVTARLDGAARAAGVAVLGTGVNPGFAMDYLPVVLSAAMRRVDRVDIHRVQDAGLRRIPLQQKVGAGITVEEFAERVRAGTIGHVGLPESARMIAAAFGWNLTDVRETLEPHVADRPTPSGLGEIAPGRVTGIHQIVSAVAGDREVVALTLDMAVGLDAPRDEIRLFGDPDLSTVIPGGLHGDVATAAVVVNALAITAGAPPGLRVMTELPPPRPRP